MKQLETTKSIQIQRIWRGYQSRADNRERDLRKEAFPLILRIMQRAPVVMRHYHPHTVVLTLKHATDINAGARSSSSAYVVAGSYGLLLGVRAVSAHRIGAPLSPPSLPHALLSVLLLCLLPTVSSCLCSFEGGKSHVGNRSMLCQTKSSVVPNTLSPVWPENTHLLMSPAQWNALLVITVMHLGGMFGSDCFLGQVK